MDHTLNPEEIRVLGSLLEKEMATPDYYPLSLVALVNACNQKSSREPVVSYDEEIVLAALAGLQEKKMVYQSTVGRVPKFEQTYTRALNLVNREAAALCLLFLRGPQTVGEIRGRSERLYAFRDIEEVGETLIGLEEMGLVAKLPRQPGHKEIRYGHLLSGQLPKEPVTETAAAPARREDERVAALELEVEELRGELQRLREELGAFRRQFE